MPATPTTRNDSKQITLPQFVNALNKHLHISRTEAMKLLRVDTLDGLNYWDAYKQLQALLARQASSQEPPAADKTRPIAREAAQPTLHRNEQQSQSASPAQSSASRPDPTRHEPTREPSPASRSEQQRHIVPSVPQETAREAASLSGGPHALQFSANSTRVPPPRALQFDEEEEEDFVIEDEADAYAYDDEDEEDEAYVLPIDREKERASAQLKLERLKGIRGSQAASPERLRVLDNLIDSQISEEQLQTMIQSIWGAATTKKLKNAQVEELISWAKEDFFVEEVEAMLKLMQETKE
jgi:hypothetical protein